METIYLKIVLAIIFALAVLAKLAGKTKSTFDKAGYGPEVMYATAIGEFIFTILLFTRFELLAAIGLLAIIGGAIFTLFRQNAELKEYILAIISTILLCLFLYFLTH